MSWRAVKTSARFKTDNQKGNVNRSPVSTISFRGVVKTDGVSVSSLLYREAAPISTGLETTIAQNFFFYFRILVLSLSLFPFDPVLWFRTAAEDKFYVTTKVIFFPRHLRRVGLREGLRLVLLYEKELI